MGCGIGNTCSGYYHNMAGFDTAGLNLSFCKIQANLILKSSKASPRRDKIFWGGGLIFKIDRTVAIFLVFLFSNHSFCRGLNPLAPGPVSK